jgi:hypothetical protein
MILLAFREGAALCPEAMAGAAPAISHDETSARNG